VLGERSTGAPGKILARYAHPGTSDARAFEAMVWPEALAQISAKVDEDVLWGPRLDLQRYPDDHQESDEMMAAARRGWPPTGFAAHELCG